MQFNTSGKTRPRRIRNASLNGHNSGLAQHFMCLFPRIRPLVPISFTLGHLIMFRVHYLAKALIFQTHSRQSSHIISRWSRISIHQPMRRVQQSSFKAQSRCIFVHFTQKGTNRLAITELWKTHEKRIIFRAYLVEYFQLAAIVDYLTRVSLLLQLCGLLGRGS